MFSDRYSQAWVAVIHRLEWPLYAGLRGRYTQAWVAGIHRLEWPVLTCLVTVIHRLQWPLYTQAWVAVIQRLERPLYTGLSGRYTCTHVWEDIIHRLEWPLYASLRGRYTHAWVAVIRKFERRLYTGLEWPIYAGWSVLPLRFICFSGIGRRIWHHRFFISDNTPVVNESSYWPAGLVSTRCMSWNDNRIISWSNSLFNLRLATSITWFVDKSEMSM